MPPIAIDVALLALDVSQYLIGINPESAVVRDWMDVVSVYLVADHQLYDFGWVIDYLLHGHVDFDGPKDVWFVVDLLDVLYVGHDGVIVDGEGYILYVD